LTAIEVKKKKKLDFERVTSHGSRPCWNKLLV
jgi:hypothetical protein